MTIPEERAQTLGEEIANTVSHGMALLAAAVAVPVLIVTSARHGSALNVAATCVFAATMVLLYLRLDALPRRFRTRRAKRMLCRKLDHGAIFLFIAGSYTPFALGALDGPLGMDAVRPRLGARRASASR